MIGPEPSVLDVFYRCLADSRRRVVLSYLFDINDESVTVDELVDVIVNAETHSSPPDQRSVEVTLVHNHLPVLADKGLIEFDRNRGAVSPTPRTEQIKPFMAVVQDETSPATQT